MSRSKIKPLTKWLASPAGQLSPLLDHVRLLRHLSAVLREVLTGPMTEHCRAANLDGTTLVISADSPAWATKLRYQLSSLLAQLQAREDLPPIERLRVRIQPADQARPAPVARRQILSPEAAEVIAHVADNTTDPKLQAALRRLARHADKKRP